MRNTRIFIVVLFFLTLGLISHARPNFRIISLAPSLTKMLYLLEAQDDLIGCTSYCDIAKKDHKAIVASAIDVNIEKIVLLKPDLVLATTITKPATIEALKKLGIKVGVLPMPKSFNEICNQLIEIGKLTGKQNIAQCIVNKQRLRINTLKQLIPKGEQPKIFFEIGAKPIFTAIPNTFMDDFITHVGGKNIASDLKSGSITRESVLLRNPDVIVIVTMGIVGKEEKTSWESYSNLNATKKKKIFIIDSDKTCSPTPVNFVDVVEQLIELIYSKRQIL